MARGDKHARREYRSPRQAGDDTFKGEEDDHVDLPISLHCNVIVQLKTHGHSADQGRSEPREADSPSFVPDSVNGDAV